MIIGILVYATITWILPNFINGIGFIKSIVNPSKTTPLPQNQDAAIAPPVLNIPYEATNSAEIDIEGYATPNSKVIIYLDEQPKQTVEVSSDGNFTAQNIELFLGTNNIFGKTINEEGKMSLPSKTIRLMYINEAPRLSISEPEDNKKIQGGDKKVKVSGKTDAGVKVFINDSQVIVGSDGSFGIDEPLNEGDNIISVKAQDAALNTAEIQRTINYSP